MLIEAGYTCRACGEWIVIEVDPTGGSEQEYVEDCPVCCRPHVLTVIWIDGEPDVQARPE